MMRKTILAVLIPLLLTACGGTSGGSASSMAAAPIDPAIEARVSSKAAASAQPYVCPSVGIVEDLRSMTLFQDNNTPDPNGIVAYGKIDDFDGSCVYENGMVSIDLDVMFAGRAGPKMTRGRSGEPTVSFPYFIAISDDQGNILNKEVFAVAVRFNEGLESGHKAEHLKPRIPIASPQLGGRYQVLIGFQLNRDQLSFNRGG